MPHNLILLALAVFVVILVGWFVVKRILRNTNRKRLFAADIPSEWIAIIEANIPIYAKLPEELKRARPDVEWQDIKDFRNLLTHEYFGVDLEIVWRIIEDDLPLLMDAIRGIMRTESEAD